MKIETQGKIVNAIFNGKDIEKAAKAAEVTKVKAINYLNKLSEKIYGVAETTGTTLSMDDKKHQAITQLVMKGFEEKVVRKTAQQVVDMYEPAQNPSIKDIQYAVELVITNTKNMMITKTDKGRGGIAVMTKDASDQDKARTNLSTSEGKPVYKTNNLGVSKIFDD